MKIAQICALLLAILGALAPRASAQQSDFQKPYLQYLPEGGVQIKDYELHIYARQRDASGLLRDVVMEYADDNRFLVRAQYARRGADGEWILGDTQSYQFRNDGTLGAQARAERLTLSAGKFMGTHRGVANLRAVVTDGGLQLRAARQEFGLLHDVLVKAVMPPAELGAPAELGLSTSMRIFAKYARRNPKQLTHWILGDVVLHNFNADGSLYSEERLARMEVWTESRGAATAPVFIFKKEAGTQIGLKLFGKKPSRKPQTSDAKARGFQLL